jgi:hypothetical protein
MRGGTDRVPDIGIIVSGHTSLRNADRRSNQSVAALGALVAQKRGCAGALPAALPLFAAGLGALGLLGWRRKRRALPYLAHGSQRVECVADVADGSFATEPCGSSAGRCPLCSHQRPKNCRPRSGAMGQKATSLLMSGNLNRHLLSAVV